MNVVMNSDSFQVIISFPKTLLRGIWGGGAKNSLLSYSQSLESFKKYLYICS
jgi:hypothetical protein